MKSLAQASIHDIQQALNSGDISAQEIARQTLENIDKANPSVNAYTHVTHERMLSEAGKIDKLRASGATLPPLAAVPYAVKNLIDVTGEVTLAGASLNSSNPVARQDAFVVSRLTEQGALLSGMLNMDAYAYGFTTDNCH